MALLEDDEVEDADDGARMTLVEHLTELRRRIVVSILAIAVGAVVAFIFYNRILDFLMEPYCEARGGGNCRLFVTSPMEGVTTRLKVAGFTGLFAASPILLWQLWRFITPGLHRNEKRYAIPFVASSVLLFLGGLVLAFITFPKALSFLIDISGPNIDEIFSPSRYITFMLQVMVAFGLAFEFPVVLVFLEIAGVLSPRQLASWRRQAAVGILAAAAVITPSQDPWTLMAMAGPMYFFYEVAIIIGKILKR